MATVTPCFELCSLFSSWEKVRFNLLTTLPITKLIRRMLNDVQLNCGITHTTGALLFIPEVQGRLGRISVVDFCSFFPSLPPAPTTSPPSIALVFHSPPTPAKSQTRSSSSLLPSTLSASGLFALPFFRVRPTSVGSSPASLEILFHHKLLPQLLQSLCTRTIYYCIVSI